MTIHGFNPDGLAIDRAQGWWLRATAPGGPSPRRITCQRAALEALRGGVIIFGLEGGGRFERAIVEAATQPEFAHYGLPPHEAVLQMRRLELDRFGIARLRNLLACLEITGSDGTKVHVSKESSMWHRSSTCEHRTSVPAV